MFDDRLGRNFDPAGYDPKDPDPWLALFLDRSLPIEEGAKIALLRGNDSYSRRFLLPFSRPFLFIVLIAAHIFRRFFQRWPNSPRSLHKLIHWGLRNFATPDANLLILRHFNLATELLAFIKDNVPGVAIHTIPLRPTRLADLEDNTFLQHDLNVYNFIIELNKGLREQGREIEAPRKIEFSAISDAAVEFDPFPNRWHNFVDVQTAIEFYTPVYALFLSRHDFVRAANSLQLDETVAVYLAKILGSAYHLPFIINGHPMVPLSTFNAGLRLMLHGYGVEAMHGYLRWLKAQQAGSASD